MIRLDKITKLYQGGREALRDVSLDISPGEMIFLTGHSGAGKSTILKLLALVERPTRGQLLVDGRNIGRLGGQGDSRLPAPGRHGVSGSQAAAKTVPPSTTWPCRW